MNQYWDANDQAWIMPALYALQQAGTVDKVEDWSTLKTEVERKLAEYGAESYAESLVEPLNNAVRDGADFKELVGDLSAEYEVAGSQQPVPVESEPETADGPAAPAERTANDEVPAFTAGLPTADQLAEQIVMDLGGEISGLIASTPELAEVSDEELVAWITEDVQSAIDEIAEAGWVV